MNAFFRSVLAFLLWGTLSLAVYGEDLHASISGENLIGTRDASPFGGLFYPTPGPTADADVPNFGFNNHFTISNGGSPYGDPSTDPTASYPIYARDVDANYVLSADQFHLWKGQVNPAGNFANQFGTSLYQGISLWSNSESFTMPQLRIEIRDTMHLFDQSISFENTSTFPDFTFWAKRSDGVILNHLAADGTPQNLIQLWWSGPTLTHFVQYHDGLTPQQLIVEAYSMFNTPDQVTTTFTLYNPDFTAVAWQSSVTQMVVPEPEPLTILVVVSGIGAGFVRRRKV